MLRSMSLVHTVSREGESTVAPLKYGAFSIDACDALALFYGPLCSDTLLMNVCGDGLRRLQRTQVREGGGL